MVGWRLVGSGININIASSTDDNLDMRARDESWVWSTKTMLMGGQVGMAGWFLTEVSLSLIVYNIHSKVSQ